ncbi:hypothetical protein GCM10007301_51330 [Azorhizobium oxalatiphilum]|uniref:PNPLA domain-containing protein n=1 Tax=Azorhizobium oxalatiphilum TaxID=980631 RepID=A0A917CDF5_9HYPH|nr:hypothetical protein [Azorhizobium oxalatiphilum]GGF85172.1 hypothetical protein GCM10007301_51330 [Azorhizobium oxalatiphilum]
MSDAAHSVHGWRAWWRYRAHALWRFLAQWIPWLWQQVLALFTVAWVLRAPVLSLVAGFLLFGLAPQAQDTLIHIAMVEQEGVLPDYVYRALGLAASTFVFWAMPTHYAARLLLETDRRYLAIYGPISSSGGMAGWWALGLQTWTPRLLGAATFLPPALGAVLAIKDLPRLAQSDYAPLADDLRIVALILLGGGVAFLIYTLWRRQEADSGLLHDLDIALGERFGPFLRFMRLIDKDTEAGELRTIGRLVLLLHSGIVVVILLADPQRLAGWLPLALAVPLLLGGWVPLLSVIGHYGRLIHAPLILIFILTAPLTTWIVASVAPRWQDHEVRIAQPAAVPSPGPPPATEGRLDLETALARWMKANDCLGNGATCPRPIIVAAAGGASRAGFFTASTVGHFLNANDGMEGWDVQDAGRRIPRMRLDSEIVANRIFAISGVSGGALGATVVAAALADRPRNLSSPCTMPTHLFWYGRAIRTAQDCLEALTAGDYLTPVFFGLAFHDWFKAMPFGRALDKDRAALLEQAWEIHFATLTDSKARREDGDRGLSHRLFQSSMRADGRWVPLLVLNGTSVGTGQRIITSDLLPTYCPSPWLPNCPERERQHIFRQSLDYQALIAPDATPARDIRLSTAASNSARFPVLSPPGTIRDPSLNVIDRVVDGGYFENFGALSAQELAEAMVVLKPGLAPFFLVISNDPEGTALSIDAGIDGALTADIADAPFFSDVTAPLDAIGKVRSGRGRLAVSDLQTWASARYSDTLPGALGRLLPDEVTPPMPLCDTHVALVQVWPQVRTHGVQPNTPTHTSNGACAITRDPSRPDDVTAGAPARPSEQPELRKVSMSWWLSKPVQVNLRQQLEASGDSDCSNDAAIAAVWEALQTRSDACYAPGGPERHQSDR